MLRQQNGSLPTPCAHQLGSSGMRGREGAPRMLWSAACRPEKRLQHLYLCACSAVAVAIKLVAHRGLWPAPCLWRRGSGDMVTLTEPGQAGACTG